MKRVPVLSVVLALLILGGFLLLFPLEWVGLLVLLLALIAAQVVIVRRHLFPAGTASTPRAAAVSAAARTAARSEASRPAADATPAAATAGQGAPAAPTAGAEAPAAATSGGDAPGEAPAEAPGAPPFSPELFSRFREHLEAAERAPENDPGAAPEGAGEEATAQAEPEAEPAAEAEPAPAGEGAAGDRVVLSAAARRKAQAPRAKAMEPPAPPPQAKPAPQTTPTPAAQAGDAAGGDDLFDDLRPRPLAGSAPPEPAPQEAEKPAEPAAAAPAAGKGGKGRRGRKAATTEPPAGEDQLQSSLAEAGPPAGPRQEEGAMLLKMAEDALAQQDRAGAQAGLEQAQALYEGLPGGVPWRARMVQARLAVLDGDLAAAVQAFEGFLKDHPELEEPDYLAPIDQLTASLTGEEAAGLRVSLLQKVLAVLRQANDRRGMDRVYDRIETAQEQAGDDQKLIQTYKNHLEIKRVLDDVDGQLALIDQIGNRYYKLGDTKAAREFYEQGMKLRGEQEAAADAAKAGEA